MGSYSYSVNTSVALDDTDILIHQQLGWDLDLLYLLSIRQITDDGFDFVSTRRA